MQIEVREQRGRYGTFDWPDLEPMFTERLDREDFSDSTVLDLGTGEGRLALHLAPRAGRVVGIDTDEEALTATRDRARELRLSNVTFLLADADTANYRLLVRSPIDYVVASHFMSEPAIVAAAKGLRSGGQFLFVCHHRDNWTETGRVGRFSFDEERMEELLRASGFGVRFLGIERTVVTYDDLEALAAVHPELHEKFREDGRWDALRRRFGTEAPSLTWAALVGSAEKP